MYSVIAPEWDAVRDRLARPARKEAFRRQRGRGGGATAR